MSSKAFSLGIRALASLFVLFQLYTAFVGALPFLIQNPIHVLFALVLVYLLVSPRGKEKTKVPIYDWIAIVLLLITIGYILINSERIMSQAPRGTWLDVVLGSILTVLVMEAGRRQIGLTFPILTTVVMGYTVFGHLIPGKWGHFPISFKFMMESIYLSTTGLWGMLTSLSATIIAMFIIFGAFLLFTEGGRTFVDLALPLTGRMWGGPAKVATIASAFFGMISGSAIANTAGTGNFTIPLMKRLGYRPEFAAAVEATASTGGIFTPPVMGATAFILAELTGVSYLRVMAAAVIPAFLFYFGVYFSIDAHAHKEKLAPVPPELIPPLRDVLTWRRLAPVVLPIIILIGMLGRGYSAFYASFWAAVAVIVIYWFLTSSIADIKVRLKKTGDALEGAGKSLMTIVPLLACASIVIGLINLSGIGIKFSELIISFGRSNTFLTLIVAAVLGIILGMGLPATAAYVLLAAVAAPGLEKLGMFPLGVHMFMLYFACISGITPPVCPNVFVASAIAKSDWLKTGWQAMKLAFIIYIIPFVFVYDTPLLMEGPPLNIISLVLAAIWATFLITIGFGGFFLTRVNPVLRLIFFVSGGLILIPQLLPTVAGIVLSVLAMAFLIMMWRREKNKPAYQTVGIK